MSNFFKKYIFILFALLVLSFKTMQSDYYKKVYKPVSKLFKIDRFNLIPVSISRLEGLKVINDQNFKAITTDSDSLIGYTVLDKANSKFSYFDYLVVLDNKMQIKLVKVLVYREEHGDEIQSKRWLKQFVDLTGNNRAILDDNIDGISGATISVKSLTKKIDDILIDLNNLSKTK